MPVVKIIFNGREYASVDAMPEAERRQYLDIVARLGDADGNGIPDVAEKGGNTTMNVTVHRSLSYNGQPVGDLRELPPEARAMLEKAGSESPGVTVQAGIEPKFRDVTPTSLFRTPPESAARTNRVFLIVLLIALAALAGLWFSGVRPQDLFAP